MQYFGILEKDGKELAGAAVAFLVSEDKGKKTWTAYLKLSKHETNIGTNEFLRLTLKANEASANIKSSPTKEKSTLASIKGFDFDFASIVLGEFRLPDGTVFEPVAWKSRS